MLSEVRTEDQAASDRFVDATVRCDLEALADLVAPAHGTDVDG